MSDESTRREVSSGGGAPPPRRGGGDTPPAGPATSPATPRATPPAAAPVVVPAPDPGAGDAAADRSGRRDVRTQPTVERTRLPLLVRALAWVIAVPLGLVLVGLPARKLGYLSGQKLLDVVIGHNVDRFTPLVVIVVLWALVTAVLVQVFAEGGAWLVRRRRTRRAAAEPPAADPQRSARASERGGR